MEHVPYHTLSDLDPAAATQYFDEVAAWVYTTYGVRLTAPDPAKAKISRARVK